MNRSVISFSQHPVFDPLCGSFQRFIFDVPMVELAQFVDGKEKSLYATKGYKAPNAEEALQILLEYITASKS